MAVVREIGDREVDRVVSADRPVLLEFFATRCGACRRLVPVLDRVAEGFAGRVDVVKLNVDENPAAVDRFEVSSTPTLVLFRAGEPVARLVGAQQEGPLTDWLSEALADCPAEVGSWVPVDSCTLPTVEQPLRMGDFANLFATALRGVERVSSTRLRLELDSAAEALVRDLVARESDCCGFFTFTFGQTAAGLIDLVVDVPAVRTAVLDGLAAQASAATAGA